MVLERFLPRARRSRRSTRGAAWTLVAVAGWTACSASSGQPTTGAPGSPRTGPALVDRLAAGVDAVGTDVIAVWICEVPADTVEPDYAHDPFRLALTPEDVVERAGTRLARYFETISHGLYTVSLVAGGTVAMAPDEESHDCVDRAIDQQVQRDTTPVDAVLAVADAEHAASVSGGWGTAGDAAECAETCTLATSRRAAYVGASDFHPDWGAVPALDLIEHELGHTLGLPHSGASGDGESGYASALDLMSNSASPRDVDPSRRDGPDILAVDRLALGWLALDDVAVVGAGATDDEAVITIAPSTGPAGVRLAVVTLDEHRMLTVELLTATGFDAHLPESGVAVHLVDDSHGDGTSRSQATVGGSAPFTDLLTTGETLTAEGWTITVTGLDAGGAQLAIRPSDR